MSKNNKVYLKDVLSTLGQQLSFPNAELTNTIQNECHYNAWFTPENVASAVKAIGQMLNGEDISKWLDRYELAPRPLKRVGLILAGNIPLVGFHDVLCVLVSGNYALIKASSQDTRLIKQVLDLL
ncbi:MAG: acyl-CoA reductase, partial [Bacteroidetes bacterium]|nr:acyl-CoA reductase [Bacteroidota bacterium]